MSSGNQCAICSEESSECCGRCQSVYYCSRACQRKHWNVGHRFACLAAKPVEYDAAAAHNAAQWHLVWAALQDLQRRDEAARLCDENFDKELQLIDDRGNIKYQKATLRFVSEHLLVDAQLLQSIRLQFADGWKQHGAGALIYKFESLEDAIAYQNAKSHFMPLSILKAYLSTHDKTVQALASGKYDHTTDCLLLVAIKRGVMVDTTQFIRIPN